MGSPAENLVAINARLKGKTISKGWDRDWSNAVGHFDYSSGRPTWNNFTADELRKIENQCESKFNTQADVSNCIKDATKKQSGSGSGVGNAVNNALNIFNTWQENKTNGSGASDYTPSSEPDKKSNTGLIIGVSIAGVALIGLGIWYFKFRK